jgi:hypothetical protein
LPLRRGARRGKFPKIAGTIIADDMGMKPILRFAILVLPVVAAPPALADFYKLEGRFQCLERADAICYDATPSLPPAVAPAAPAPVQAPPRPAPRSAVSTPSAPIDPMRALANRIKLKEPAPGDLDQLRRKADTGDRGAIELLAWCALHGIGTERDPVEAYLLYGKAAANAVPRARENQAVIYEQDLSQAQRQHVLDLEARATPSQFR